MNYYVQLFKGVIILMAFFVGIQSLAAQENRPDNRSVVYSTDFESFTAGGQVACQDPVNWSTWSNAPCTGEDAFISAAFAKSGANSVVVENTNDMLLLLGDKTTGNYELSWWMYVETDKAGYYNMQHFQTAGTEFAFEIYFLQNGTGEFTTGGAAAIVFDYPKASWFQVKHLIDVDNDLISLTIDDALISSWPLSYQSFTTTGTKQLGGIDFYAGYTGAEVPKYFFDDVTFKEILPPVYTTDFETFTAGGQVACQDQINWSTWSGLPCSSEDGTISTDYANSGVNSAKVENSTDLLLLLGDKTTGNYELSWSMYVEPGYCGYYNMQHFEAAGVEFAFEIYFLQNGTAEFTTQAAPAIVFNYPQGEWFLVKHIININNDLITLSVNGSQVHSWPLSALSNSSTPGTKQLGGIDFYAGASGTATPKYYFDDVMYKEADPASANDLSLQAILTPVTGPNLTNTEIVTVRVKNVGTAEQSNIPVNYAVNGGAPVNGVIAGPLAADVTTDYAFAQTANLSAVQGYEISATVALAGDENPDNNSKTKTVVNQGNVMLMQNGTITACDGSFFDTGGQDGYYQNNEDLTLTLTPATPGAKMNLNFTSFNLESGADFLKIYDGADVTAPLIGDFTGATLPTGILASPANLSGALTFHFTSNESGAYPGWAAATSCLIPKAHDLAGLTVDGPSNLLVGTIADYTITIINAGANAETGTNYTVSLFDDNNTLIGTASGTDIAIGETKSFVISWTPLLDGLAYLYGVVNLVGDQNAANNQTEIFNVNVQPTGQAEVGIGTGTELSMNVPVSPYWGYSFTQTLYLQSEMNIANKRIFRIGYQYGGPGTLDFNIEIWLKHTSLTEINETVPLATFTKVYDGPYFVNPADPYSTVDIDAFYYNNTDNLLVTVIEKKPGYTSPSDQFYSTTNPLPEIMCRGAWNDGSAYDPNNLPAGNVLGVRANIKFWMGDVPTSPEIKVTPPSVYFGEVEATVAEIRNVEVMNAGGGTLVINGAEINNPNFTVIDATFPVSLAIGEKQVFQVQFLPVDPGLEEGILTFQIDPSVPGNKTVQLSARALRYGVLREGFEGELFPPLGWKVVDVNNDSKGWVRNTGFAPTGQTAPHTGIGCASLDVYAGNPGQTSYDDWLITPKMKWQDGDVFKFYIKRLANQNGQVWRVCLSTSSDDVSSFEPIDVITDPDVSYTEKMYDLSDYGLTDGQQFYLAFQFNSLWCWPGVIDDILGAVVVGYDKDLIALDFTGPEIIYQNTANNFQATVGNYGRIAVAAGDYSVEACAFVNGIETVFGTIAGTALAVAETATLNIPVNIPDAGVYGLFAKVVYADDMDLTNNISDVKSVEVIDNSVVVKNIGTYPLTPQTPYYHLYPIDFGDWRGSSLSECLYYTNELNTGGIITRLSYYTSFANYLPQRKVKVWMVQTDKESFDQGAIPASEMTLVFEGKVDFPEGQDKVNINLTHPMIYTGSGNLAVMVYYYEGGSQYINDNSLFAYQEVEYGPLRNGFDNWYTTIDPNDLTHFASIYNFPVTSLMFETGNGLGSLAGRVLYQSDNTPVEGAKVVISNPDFPEVNAEIYTDAEGYYSAPYLMAGNNLQVTVSKYAYNDVVYNNVVLPVGGSVDLGNALLMPRPVIALLGNVILSDTQGPAAGAVVKLTGLDNYEATTNADGEYVFMSVWGLTTYQIEVTLDGYQNYESTITVPGTPYSVPQITLLENAPSPHLVNAVEDGDDALISWYAAGEPYPMEFRYDDGEVWGVLITTGDPTVIVGSSWQANASVQNVYWYMYPFEGYQLCEHVLITILGLTEDGTPDANNVLLLQENIRNNAGWNSCKLTQTVNAPNGFFVGISGYDNTSVIPYDDGEGEPYVFQTRTQWSNGLGAYYPLENATSPPLFANIFVRASGLVTGEAIAFDEKSSTTFIVEIPEGKEPSMCQQIAHFDAGEPEVIFPIVPQETSKAFTNYNVYRKPVASTVWEQLNAGPVTDTSFVDNTWSALTYGLYEFAAEAEYTNGVKSDLSISNILEKDMCLDLNLIVNTNTGVAGISAGANVILTNQNGNVNYIYYAVVGADGSIIIPEILKGIYTLQITLTGFVDYTETDVNLDIPETTLVKTVTINERIFNPYDLEIITAGQSPGVALFMWDQAPVLDDVESYEAFLIDDIGGWKVVDQDNKPTVYPGGVSFPHMGDPASFMTFSSELTTPPLTQVYWGANSGTKCFAAFGSAEGSTNNWLISEEQNHSLPFTLSFYAKSITETYGLETFRIGYSTTGNNLSDFVFMTENVTTLTYWTKFTYTIPAEAKYVTIRHNHTGYALLLDDITLGVETDGAIPANGFTVYLNDEEVVTGITNPEYQFTGLDAGSYTAGVQANFLTGQSGIEEIDFVMPEGTTVNFTVQDDLGELVDGANISILFDNTEILSDVTVNGLVTFQIYPGTYQYVVTKEGYASVSSPLVVGTTILDINVVLNNYYALVFMVKNGNALPIGGATVVYRGQSKVTTVGGSIIFSTIPGTFPYAVTHPDYDRVLSSVTVVSDKVVNVVMPSLTCEIPVNLAYQLNYNNVHLSWEAPVIGNNGTWIHWDLAHGNNIGTGGPVDFDVAQRFVPADLVAYDGKFLTRVLFWPNEPACTYSIRVWVDGNSSSAGTLLVDQIVTNPTIGAWNEVFLNSPVLVDATKEFWFGVRNNTTTGHPSGCDIGPAINGKGNMINLAGTGWQTLLEVAPTLNFNWSVRGLVEDVDSRFVTPLVALNEVSTGSYNDKLTVISETRGYSDPRKLLGYNVYRNAVQINTNPVATLSYNDNALIIGTYNYNITALWSSDCESDFSNTVEVLVAGAYGKIHGFIRDAATNFYIETATVVATNADNGVETILTPFGSYYSMMLFPGTYNLTCYADGYLPATVNGLSVVVGDNTGHTFYLAPTDQITGIEKNNASTLVIYPNPATDKVTISGINLKEVQIFNATGSMVYHSPVLDGMIEINNLRSGIYFVKALDRDGKLFTEKLVIK